MTSSSEAALPSGTVGNTEAGLFLTATSNRWDRLGAVASVACAIHCLVAPLLFLTIPTIGGIWAHPCSHALIALIVLPLACTVLCRGYRIHRRAWVAGSALLGIGCVLLGCVLPFVGDDPSPEAGEACASCCPQLVEDETGQASLGWPPASVATIIGSGFLLACHLGNFLCRRCCEANAGNASSGEDCCAIP